MLRVVLLFGLTGCQLVFPKGTSDNNTDANGDAVGDAVLGHDEDKDGIADDADNCPTIANAQQETSPVGEGVGTACDPHGALDGDRWLRTHSAFFGSSIEPLFEPTGGTWQIAGDAALNQVSPAELTTAVLPGPLSALTIEVKLDVLTTSAQGNLIELIVPTTGQTMRCTVTENDPSSARGLVALDVGDTTSSTAIDLVPKSYVLTLDLAIDHAQCTFDNQPAVTPQNGFDLNQPPTKVQLHVENVDVGVRSVVVYAGPSS